MRSLILRKVAQTVLPVATLFALYMLLRGHNDPGGGFIAGLVTASAVVLQALAFGAEATRRRLSRIFRPMAPAGLLVAVAAGMPGMLQGGAWFEHLHGYLPAPGGDEVHVSTALVFDVGVYLVVVGVTAALLSAFTSEEA